MGLIKTCFRTPYVATILILCSLLPVAIMFSGDTPLRTILKDSLSTLSVLAFFMMAALFYLSQLGGEAAKALRKADLITLHKALGYTCVAIALLHPLMIVAPRALEAGITPVHAFFNMITTMHLGVILGLISWLLVLALGITAYFRKSLPMSYKTWRVVHGSMAGVLLCLAAWHVIDLGRHSSDIMIGLILLLTVPALALLGKHYRPLLSRKA